MTEKISYRVMKTDEFNNSVFYKVECDCRSDDHILGVEISLEHGKEISSMLFLTFYKKLQWTSWWQADWFYERWWKKAKLVCAVLFNGYIELDSDIILQGEEHIQGFIDAVNEGLNKIKRQEH